MDIANQVDSIVEGLVRQAENRPVRRPRPRNSRGNG